MDLTYNPGELDLKHLQKESNSGMKREHDSVDDFEHLDPESSPVDILSKPLIEIDSKPINMPPTPLKEKLSDHVGKSDQIVKTEGPSFDKTVSNGKDKFPDIDLDSEKPKLNSELNIKTNPLGFEMAIDSIPKSVETVHFDNAMISNFISAEKASNSVKTDSDLVGLDTIAKDSGKNVEEAHSGTPKSITDDADLDVPAKSMKEADAMSHYELKLDKKEVEKKDSHSEDEKDLELVAKHELKKEKDGIKNLVKDDLLNYTTAKDFIEVGPTNPDSETNQVIGNEDGILDRDHKVGKEEQYFENKSEFNSRTQESESLEPESYEAKPQPDEKMVIEKDEAPEEEYKDFPSPDDIIKHRICICPSKPDSSVSDLDDIIGPEDVFKRIGLDAWLTPGRLHPIVEALVYWRDPKKSGVVFGGIMAILLSICYMSLISVVGHFTFFVVTGAICFRIYKNILQAIQKTSSEGHPFKDYLEVDLSLPQDKVREITDTAVVHINAALVELRRLVLVEDLIDSVKFALCMWCLTYVGAIFNGMTLVILAFVALFTVPKIYENNKASIDTYIEMGRSKVAEITSKVKAAVPIGKKEPEKDKEQ